MFLSAFLVYVASIVLFVRSRLAARKFRSDRRARRTDQPPDSSGGA